MWRPITSANIASRTPSTKARAISFEEFRGTILRGSADQIIGTLRAQVIPHYPKTELMPFIKSLMAKARWFYEARQDISSANKIRVAVFGLDYSPAQNEAVIKTLMAVANSLANITLPKGQRDFESAIQTWRSVYSIIPNKGIVIRTMMDAANIFSNGSLPKEQRDVDSAIKIWQAAFALTLEQDKLRVALTMMSVANILIDRSLPTERRDIDSAIKIWRAAYLLGSEESKQRVISTIMDIASRDNYFCQQAIELLEGRPLGYFISRVLSELYYHTGNFPAVIEVIDRAQRSEPDILSQKADALRKLRQYDAAINLAGRIVAEQLGRGPLNYKQACGLIKAYCCRGYCSHELWRSTGDKGKLEAAETDFMAAIKTAELYKYPVSPRAYFGLYLVARARGQYDLARKALASILAIDPDNNKALTALRTFR
jgi:tetratricopeptide (TPR) repeat protein